VKAQLTHRLRRAPAWSKNPGTADLQDAVRIECATLYRDLGSEKRVASVLGVSTDSVSRWRTGREASPCERLLRQVIALESAGVDTVAMMILTWETRAIQRQVAA
jgi:DNA-binding transcriptional regulator YdaS (Cro superfamily)